MLNSLLSLTKQPLSSHLGQTSTRLKHNITVLDVETTGVHVNTDRIIEIALVTLSPELEIIDEFVTLVNPKRDLGRTDIHGITAADMTNAPTFADIAGDLIERLKNKIVAGHNVRFDLSILSGEFRRLNHEIPELPSICTLNLAYKFGLQKRKLRDCCEQLGVEAAQWHSALDDAKATASLLRAYADLAREDGIQIEHLLGDLPSLPSVNSWPVHLPSGKSWTRENSSVARATAIPGLVRLVDSLPEADTVEAAQYMAVLDRVLEDRLVTEKEIQDLHDIACQIGLSKLQANAIHKEYFDSLLAAAIADGKLTKAEQMDLTQLAKLFGFDVPEFTNILSKVGSIGNAQNASAYSFDASQLNGKKVCFTGALSCSINGVLISRSHALKLVEQHGIVPTDSVTKTTDILVVADPNTMSSKAEKARKYGIRIMAETVFWNMLSVSVD